MTELTLVTHSPRETRSLGAVLGRLARSGDVFLLIGPLGAGKTCLTQGLARGLGIRDLVTSPTFTLIREYQGRLPLFHVDCFRLEGTAEALELGLDGYLGGDGLCVVEWADRVMEALPLDHLLVTLTYREGRERVLRLEARCARYAALLSELRRKIPLTKAQIA